MTRNQLNAMIPSLLKQAKRELAQCDHATNYVWAAHMAASIILSGLADALMDARDQTPIDMGDTMREMNQNEQTS